MRYAIRLASPLVVGAALLLASCGEGGGYAGDIVPGNAARADANSSFLVFPNPLVEPDGSFQTLSTTYAEAYYAAIDPANARDTLSKWKTLNGFGSATGTEVTVVFGDVRDLGYGRRMTARQNADGTIAVMVENYLVGTSTGTGYSYSGLNVEAAIVRDGRWHLGTNAIEYGPGPGGGASFVKFFTFEPSGARALTANMDGLGPKAMPGPCISCHGGRADPLTPPDGTGRRLFALVRNTTTANRGDTRARMHPLEVDSFDFSAQPGFTRADQEAAFKLINRMVLCTYPLSAPSGLAEDACRPAMNPNGNEWAGTAAAIIKNAYGGPGLPSATFADTYLPDSWLAGGQSSLYREVLVPYCRTCHIVRGTPNQADLNFDTLAAFQAYADRTRALVFERGTMPLARLVFDRFHGATAPEQLAVFLDASGFPARDGSGAPLRPGRPVADPGPARAVPPGATTLSAANSLFADAFEWSLVSGPAGASLTSSASARPTFTAATPGTYVLQLVVSNGSVRSAPAQLTIVVTNTLPIAPSAIRFSNIMGALQGGSGGCTASGCHVSGGAAPVVYQNIDRNGDGVVDATDTLWLYHEVRGLVNFTDIPASPLLRKPSGRHHNGGLRPTFDVSAAPGDAVRSGYDLFLNWILNDAPQ